MSVDEKLKVLEATSSTDTGGVDFADCVSDPVIVAVLNVLECLVVLARLVVLAAAVDFVDAESVSDRRSRPMHDAGTFRRTSKLSRIHGRKNKAVSTL